jgi:hypothetical protein
MRMRHQIFSKSFATFAPIIYPESDGQPLVDNIVQFCLIIIIQGRFDSLFINNFSVSVAETCPGKLLEATFESYTFTNS